MFRLVICLSLLFLAPNAHAGAACDNLRKDSPDLYRLYCSPDGSGASAKPAGATSTFSDAFNLSSATLPTEPSSYGIEAISTFLTSGASPGMPNLALIKGFHRFGTGLSTSAGNTFYSNDLVERLGGPSRLSTLSPPETARGYVTNLNLGTSVLIWDPSFFPRIQLGLSARYNKTTNTVGGGPALMLGTQYLSVGYGISHEQISNYLPAENFTSLLVSVRLWSLELEFTLLDTLAHDYDVNAPSRLSAVEILTATYPIKSFILTAAIRHLNYETEGTIFQPHFALQWFANSHLAIGYLYNYIPGGNSFGLQIYL